jgi:hypothetical protein
MDHQENTQMPEKLLWQAPTLSEMSVPEFTQSGSNLNGDSGMTFS